MPYWDARSCAWSSELFQAISVFGRAMALRVSSWHASTPRIMRQALASEVAPLPDRSWIRAQRQSGDLLLEQAQRTAEHSASPPADQVQRALMWLDKYCGRFATPAREVLQARKLLREASARANE